MGETCRWLLPACLVVTLNTFVVTQDARAESIGHCKECGERAACCWMKGIASSGDTTEIAIEKLHLLNCAILACEAGDEDVMASALVAIADQSLMVEMEFDDEWSVYVSLLSNDDERARETFQNPRFRVEAKALFDYFHRLESSAEKDDRDLIREAVKTGNADSICLALAASVLKDKAMPLQRLALQSSGVMRKVATNRLTSFDAGNGFSWFLQAAWWADQGESARCRQALLRAVSQSRWVCYRNLSIDISDCPRVTVERTRFSQRWQLSGELLTPEVSESLLVDASPAFRQLMEFRKSFEGKVSGDEKQTQGSMQSEIAALVYLCGLRAMFSENASLNSIVFGNVLCIQYQDGASGFFQSKSVAVDQLRKAERAIWESFQDPEVGELLGSHGALVAKNGDSPWQNETRVVRQIRSESGFQVEKLDEAVKTCGWENMSK